MGNPGGNVGIVGEHGQQTLRVSLTLVLELILVCLARLAASNTCISNTTDYFQKKILEYEEQKKQKKPKEKTVK